jgi:hypothetical protein
MFAACVRSEPVGVNVYRSKDHAGLEYDSLGSFGGPLYKGHKQDKSMQPPLQHKRICLACGLNPANYGAGQPPSFAVFLAEGRST